MKNFMLIYILVIISLINHCSNKQTNSKINTTWTNDYLINKSFFPFDLVSHFPDTLTSSCISYTVDFDVSQLDYRPGHEYFFRLYTRFDDNDILNNLKKMKYLKMCNSTDSNQLLIFSYIEDENSEYNNISITGKNYEESRKLADLNMLKSDEIPIPFFRTSFDNISNTYSGLDSSFEITIIDAKPGLFIDTKHLLKNKYLPKKWKHGYSKGVAISEEKKIIIYWVVAW